MLILLLAAIFFLTYAMLVENPFTADKLSFTQYVNAWLDITNDTQNARVSNIPLGLFVMPLGYIGVWIIRKVLSDSAGETDTES